MGDPIGELAAARLVMAQPVCVKGDLRLNEPLRERFAVLNLMSEIAVIG